MNYKNILVIGVLLCAQVGQAFEVIAGCQEQDYVEGDLSASVATMGRSYTPKCLKVVVGSEVSISASQHHPLAPLPGDGNPIPSTEQTASVLFENPGVFGYFCTRHGDTDGTGMAGAIWVIEE
ncbi:MAG: hypothetical protein KDD33_08815 [Bdellovibrionales bacterium]|nr:hypothetical protein [Bdellovibrionales bacterium]